jgi:uncharacterized membrane protein
MEQIQNKKKEINRKIAVVGALGALTVVMTVARIGFIPWFSVSITILHIPVIIAVFLEGLWAGVGVGAIFGLSSLVMSSISPTSPLDMFFVNPLVSVVPRMLFAVVTYFLLKGLLKLSKNKKSILVYIFYAIAAFVGTMVHSFFVLGILVLKKAIDWTVMVGVLAGNSLLEAAAAVVISLAVVSVMNIAETRKNKKSKLNSNIE